MNEHNFLRVDEVAKELGVSKSYAYKIVQKLNVDLKKKGLPDDFRSGQPKILYGKVLLRWNGREGT